MRSVVTTKRPSGASTTAASSPGPSAVPVPSGRRGRIRANAASSPTAPTVSAGGVLGGRTLADFVLAGAASASCGGMLMLITLTCQAMLPVSRRRLATALAVVVLAVPLLTACASPVHLTPAAKADTVGCADVIVRLPTTVEGQRQRETDAQSTSAWGSPAGILLTCGITTPTVSPLSCFSPGGVDWLADRTGPGDTTAVYTTYGRVPGVRVVVDTTQVPSDTNVLFDIAAAVKLLPQKHHCQSVSG